jgi:aryl-alcohol dehydrogenase-like predicted oxidoreductase
MPERRLPKVALRHSAVTSVVTGMRSALEVQQNFELMRVPIPAEFWSMLEQV